MRKNRTEVCYTYIKEMPASIILVYVGENLVGRKKGSELLCLVVVQSHSVAGEDCLNA